MNVREDIVDVMMNNPVIAAVSSIEDVREALESPCDVLFLLEASVGTMKEMVELIHCSDKLAFIHVDLMKGLACDNEGLVYLKEVYRPDGVISTRGSVIRKAMELGFVTVQRLFVLDSKSIGRGAKQLREIRPDFAEVMPGIMSKIIRRIVEQTKTPIIAGGLIDDKQEVIELIKAGAVCVSTSSRTLWYA